MSIDRELVKKLSGWEELKESLAHLMGSFWVLLCFALIGYAVKLIRIQFQDELWSAALYWVEKIDLIVMVVLFALMGISILLFFVKRLFHDGTNIVLA